MGESAEQMHPKKAFGWAASDSSGEKDVAFKVMYCGICHSDLHKLKNEWGTSTYPLVPEHEIVGVVTEVGSKVQKFKVGDKVGVGCMVGSCHSCDNCANNLENYYGTTTYGGYSDKMVADEHFVVRIPDSLPLDVYSPLKYFGLDKPGMHVGVVGLGGLGHVAVKFAKAMGVKVTVISTSPNKKEEAIEHLGADSFLVSRNQDEMQVISFLAFLLLISATSTLDRIIDTVSAPHPILSLIGLLKTNGNLILPNIIYTIDYVNTILERLLKANVKYRFVIDIGNTLKSTSSI
ncbi:hypothetical protein ACOSQ4_023802 [Xanthoceras sorbifolium]